MNKKVVSAVLSITVILFVVALNFFFMRLTHEAIFPTISKNHFRIDTIKDIDSVLNDKPVKESVKLLNKDLTILTKETSKTNKAIAQPRKEQLNISLSVNMSINESNSLTNTPVVGPLTNDTHNYVDENNVFGFWNLKLLDMYNNKYFNINWTRYEVLAKRDFNITDQDFSWDLVDQKLDEYMISTENLNVKRSTIHEFNRLKKKYYNWINVLNDDGKYYWDVSLSDIDKNKDFQKIWNWGNIRNKAALLTGQNSTNLNWDLVELKIYNYLKDKSLYYYNYNFTSDLIFESFIDEVITIKAKYTDYEFLMNNNFYFRDIETDSEFQSNINWTTIETKIRILLNVTEDEDLNMTQVDLMIKEYEFNSRNFTAKEIIIIKDLITVERKYREYLTKKNGIDSGKNSTSNGLMSDIGNNIHQGTSMSILFSLEKRKSVCEKKCVDKCEKNFIESKNKQGLFSCVAILCFCDEKEYSKSNRFNITNDVFIFQYNTESEFYFYFTIAFIIGLLLLVIYYEGHKSGDFFNTISKDDVNNMEKFEKAVETKRREEKAYDYILLNDQQMDI